ncbi:hypothetical protein H072_9101 [Dactylellina haptotyla CBS 200.50]|uniref:CHAT domain-containing protein n=1 Tax=Dactylellina haptotyla (strain CBS 200.50) TaxID=1284197 RepID=S8BPW6_DACHA|nr:hypothetical protein H072_9101 [Dactylellina haptotyla CBS 200.50]
MESFADFLSTLTISAGCGGLNEYQNAEIEASARLLLGYALAKNQLEGPESDTMTENLNRAWELFGMCDSPLGQTEIAMLSMKYHVSLDNIKKPPEWEDIEACFKSMEYFRGLIKCAEYRADVEVNSTYNCTISPSLQPTGSSFYKRLLSIAKKAGDNLLFRICQVRSMPNWVESPTFIMICENVFHPKEGFLSDQLFLEASKLLGQLYEINNNFFESSAFGLLHLRISFARSDSLLIDYATMLYFRCVGNMVPTIDDKDRIYEIACLVLSFDKVAARVCHSILGGIESCTPINPGGLPIESLLWPAEVVRHIVEDNGAQTMSPQVISAVYRSLKLAVDLLLLLPEAFHGIFFSKICHALGNAGRMIANPMLSLYGYELGRSRPNKFDGYHEAVLQLNIGRHLASWVHNDRPNFAGLQTLAFGYLDEAINFFWDEGARQSSYKNGLEASLVLARAHLGEVQCLSEELDCGEDTASEDNVITTEQETNKQRLLDHVEAGLLVIRKAVSRNLTLRRRLSGLPPMQALENSRLLYFGDMEELYWNEVGLEMERSRLTGDLRSCLVAIQKWKAASLQDIMSQRLEPAVRAPNKIVLEDVGSTEATFPSVLSLGDELPIFEEESIWAMAELAEAHIDEGRSVIFVDWVRCYDALCIIAYNGTEGRIKKAPVELEYHKIEEWVQSELGVLSLHQGRTDRQRLQKYSRLRELMPILEALQGFVKPNDLLVLCPSGILHAVPLQAIPFGPKERPLIISNPVVFCQSFSLLKTCVNNVENSLVLSSIPAAAFTRIGSDDVQEASRMHETARDGLANKSFQACVLSEKEVTRAAFMSQARGVRLLHYHGHAYLEADQRRDRALRLEPQSTPTESPLDDGLLSVMDIFELRLNSALVVLMACASGEDDIAPNDDPLGLLSAFLYAGASSVICTRWPTQTSDAREFAKRFYNHAFRGRKNGFVNIAAAVQAATIELWELWDEDYPYHWAQFQLHGSWFGKI